MVGLALALKVEQKFFWQRALLILLMLTLHLQTILWLILANLDQFFEG